jgi:hypothetical protein
MSDKETIETNEAETEEEFRTLFTEIVGQRQRLKGVAQKLGGEGGRVLAEVDGTVLDLLQDLVAHCGAAFESIEDRLYNLEEDAAAGMPTESFLLPEDAEQYVAYFEQIKRLLNELSAVPDAPAEQKEVFAALGRMTDDRLEFTRMIAGEDDGEGDDDGGSEETPEPKEGEGVGEA